MSQKKLQYAWMQIKKTWTYLRANWGPRNWQRFIFQAICLSENAQKNSCEYDGKAAC